MLNAGLVAGWISLVCSSLSHHCRDLYYSVKAEGLKRLKHIYFALTRMILLRIQLTRALTFKIYGLICISDETLALR